MGVLSAPAYPTERHAPSPVRPSAYRRRGDWRKAESRTALVLTESAHDAVSAALQLVGKQF